MGSMPRDGGNLIIGPSEYDEVAADPVAAKYVRRFMMGKELIHDLPRWCLWLEGLDPPTRNGSPCIMIRLAPAQASGLPASGARPGRVPPPAAAFDRRLRR